MQKNRSYCPELNFYSNFNDYAIYERFGKKFVEALYGEEDLPRFCKESMQPNIVDKILLTYQKRKGGMENIYKIFMYLGAIDFAENVEFNLFGIDTLKQDPDRATQNPNVMKGIIGKAQGKLDDEIDRVKMLGDFGNR